MSFIDSQNFDNLKKDHYTEAESEAALELFAKLPNIASDPYLLFEVHKAYSVCNRKYQPTQNNPRATAKPSHSLASE